MNCLAIRGATSVESNRAEAIVSATRELLERLVEVNDLQQENIISVIFTATPDLDRAYPANAAREIGWVDPALLCMQEMVVDGSLPRCIRVLIHYIGPLPRDQIQHVYLGRAQALRPDLVPV